MDTQNIFTQTAKVSIAVIGDMCLDVYYFADHGRTEISVETGLETRSVNACKHELGGAGNVAVNCKRLGVGRVDIFGIIGEDAHGDIILSLLGKEGIGSAGVVRQKDQWLTHLYHKIYEGKTETPRYDIGNYNKPEAANIEKLLKVIEDTIDGYDCVIINEQVMHGIHSDAFQKGLVEIIRKTENRVTWFADCRKLNDVYAHTVHKLNDKEAFELFSRHTAKRTKKRSSEEKVIQWLYQRWERPLIMTRGEDGALVYNGQEIFEIPGLHIIKEIDTVGAGDAFMAGTVVAHGAGASLQDAAKIGNFTAGVCIQKLFETGHPSAQEVVAIALDHDYRYRPQLAQDQRLARRYAKTPIEILNPQTKGSFSGTAPEIAIFDHDGTISTLRQGWEAVMKTMMVKSIAGRYYAKLEASLLKQIEDSAKALIEKSTGVQTIIQMHALRDLVISMGLIPKEDILSPEEYKEIFNAMLMERISEKQRLLEDGRLSTEDLTMKGAVAMLRDLKARGTRLFLASGTDQEDVRKEARLLGYEELFDGGIYGSVGDVKNDPKRLVIRNIIGEIEAKSSIDPARCIVFGDGPVEMREAKKHGLTAVGIMSDERQRFGANYAKRQRLILAGADMLIPDFSWKDELSRWFGWR